MRFWLRPLATFASGLLFACACPGQGIPAVSLPVRADVSSVAIGTGVPQPGLRATIPGPLRSFLRMAGISQGAPVDDVLPLLARNAYLLGYEEGNQTEFLRLLNRYLHQARELQALAGPAATINVKGCNDATMLLRVLGYRLRQGCDKGDIFLETANPTRAFLTIDSGFPLTELEEALQNDTAFNYAYPTSSVPVLFGESDWLTANAAQKGNFGSVVDELSNNQAVARLYWAIARNDTETSTALQQSPGLRRLLPYAAILDFYGSQLYIRSGRVVVPGGAKADGEWKELVGASPDAPGDFVLHLLEKDNGWLAAYFDALSRVKQEQQVHLVAVPRMRKLYEAFRSSEHEAPPARGVFRKAPDLLVLFTRLEWDANGEVHVPGGLEVWKDILNEKTDLVTERDWAKRARGFKNPEELLEALAAFSRIETDRGPLQMYLMMSEIDAGRTPERRLSPETVRLLADRFSQLSSWYLAFTEFPELSDQSIARFVNVAEAIDKVSNQALRGNTLGAFQANVGLWEILARQGEIPKSQMDSSWQKVVGPFAKIGSTTQLFDAARGSLSELLIATTGKADRSQDEIVELMAGPNQESPDGKQIHSDLAARIRSVLNDQRLVTFDTLFALSDGLDEMAKGKPANQRLIVLAGELRDFELPRQIFSSSEKAEWAPKASNGHHAELQVKIDLTKVIKTPGTRLQLEAARGQLAPLLRDALVGLNYAYYEPPGAQILHINPLFVRSHDFIGVTVRGADRLWQAPMLLGAGISAGGGGYLMGSLADLSYSLAAAEQDLIAPENVQALIWKELVPGLLANAAMTRWWNVGPHELHAVALFQRSGEELLGASVKNSQLRDHVVSILSDRLEPRRLGRVELALKRADDLAAVLPRLMPADTFYLGAEFNRRFPNDTVALGQAGLEAADLARLYPSEVSWERLSKDFGVPHPTLARTYGRELLNVRPFPFFGGYSSRLFGESWESGNLYWARLADEMGYSPVMLNRLVPELTRRMTAKIFATDLEDWPAMLRAMQETGNDLRQGKIMPLPRAVATTSTEQRPVRDASGQ